MCRAELIRHRLVIPGPREIIGKDPPFPGHLLDTCSRVDAQQAHGSNSSYLLHESQGLLGIRPRFIGKTNDIAWIFLDSQIVQPLGNGLHLIQRNLLLANLVQDPG